MISLILTQKSLALSNNNDFLFQESLLESKSYYFEKDNYEIFSLNLNAQYSKNINNLIDEIKKDDEDSLISYINDNLGKRHYLKSNNYFKLMIKDIELMYNYSGFTSLDMNNPIINEVDSTIVKKQSLSIQRKFKLNKEIELIPKLIYGKRDIKIQKIYPSDFLEEDFKIEFDWNKNNYSYYLDSNLRLNYYHRDSLIFSTEIEGMSLSNKQYNYWRINTGIHKNILNNNLYKLNIFGKFSPIYSGTYSADFLYEIGIENLFFKDHWKLIAFMRYKGIHILNEFDLFFMKVSGEYSNSYITPYYKDEQIKLNFKLYW